MRPVLSLRALSLETAAAAAVSATIFAFALGASSVTRLNDVGTKLRWVALGALVLLAVGQAVVRRARISLGWPALLAVGLALLAVGSSLWSATPRLTAGRSLTFAALVLAAVAFAVTGGDSRERVERTLLGVLGGAVLVALAGLALAAVDPSAVAQGGSNHALSRFRGFGERPTTDAMLYAVALPISLLLVTHASRRARAAGIGAFVLLAALLVASGSRGPQFGAVLGMLAFGVALGRRGRIQLAGALVATAVLAVVVGLIQMHDTSSASPTPSPDPAPPARVVAPPPPDLPQYPNPGALDQEFGHGPPSSYVRSFWTSSGRTEAWRWAIGRADERPVLGFGFGTEDRVFEDHYLGYQGSLVSSSWIGLYLQLGAVGVAALAALWAALGAAAVRTLRRARHDRVAVACACAVVAAFPLTFVESWIYSVGNVATVPFWLSALLLGTLARGGAPGLVPARAAGPGEVESLAVS